MHTRSATSANANGMFRASSEGAIMSALNVKQGRKDCKRKDRDRAGNSYHGPNVMKQVYYMQNYDESQEH